MRSGVVKGITVAVALAAALACTRKQPDDAWFPLAKGRTWAYTLTPQGEGMEPIKLTVAVVGPEDLRASNPICFPSWSKRRRTEGNSFQGCGTAQTISPLAER